MRPTADDALDGAARLLRALVADGTLAQVDADPLLLLLTQARVPSARLAFLDRDDRELRVLLLELSPALTSDLAGDISSQALLASDAPALDHDEAESRNAGLRELLARALPVLDGADRERVRLHLLGGLDRRPA